MTMIEVTSPETGATFRFEYLSGGRVRIETMEDVAGDGSMVPVSVVGVIEDVLANYRRHGVPADAIRAAYEAERAAEA
ncbi:hypothetical protein ACM64Y_00680 [Novispirillum sp. DQ9]|uniref:hypothetical protein n=1 Tax=Novispirillum sp. DQ9 TaxID=3398612 RepID=UPI003C7D73BB